LRVSGLLNSPTSRDTDMPDARPQDYTTHRKWVPPYHFIAPVLLLANLVFAVVKMIGDSGIGHGVRLLTAVALIILFYYTRAFALGVQDRVIRLEERLRFERVLPEDLRGRIGEFTTRQLIGLRFADDAELPALARRVLDEGITDREAIKKQVTAWRADDCRI